MAAKPPTPMYKIVPTSLATELPLIISDKNPARFTVDASAKDAPKPIRPWPGIFVPYVDEVELGDPETWNWRAKGGSAIGRGNKKLDKPNTLIVLKEKKVGGKQVKYWELTIRVKGSAKPVWVGEHPVAKNDEHPAGDYTRVIGKKGGTDKTPQLFVRFTN